MDEVHDLELSDGRLLSVRVSGPPKGVPLVFHHGTPGALPPPRVVERAAHARNLRLVTTSRPGYGNSDRRKGRRVVDVVPDTAEVLELLQADRCLVAGWSGGGPHTLACAAKLEPTVGALVIAGVAPYQAEGLDWVDGMGEENVVEFAATLAGEATLRPYLEEQRMHVAHVTLEQLISSLSSLLPAVDVAVLTDEFGEDMVVGFAEALRVGVDGWLDDDLAFTEPWGFSLEEISIPTMLWHGSADLMVPFAHGQWHAAHIPGVSAHLLEGEGHLSIGVGAIDLMFDELVETLS